MVFASPIWLLGLLPWAAVVLYLLPGKGRAQAVPFLEFWKGATIPSRRTVRRVPPISILLVLMALLLAVLAAAKPMRVVKGISVREISIVPEKPAPYVAITAVGARSSPRPEVMVRVENHSERKSVQLKVGAVEKQIVLPPRGQSVDQFIDVDKLDDVVTAQIDSDPARNPRATAYLVKQSAGIKIVVDHDLPDYIKRIAAVYSKDRPGDGDARPVVVSNQRLDPEQAGVWVQAEASESRANHLANLPPEIMRNVTSRPAVDFVSVRENPAQQVWVNTDLGDWAKTPDFVIFFGNVFDWLAGGNQQYVLTNDRPPGVTTAKPHLLEPRESLENWLIIASLGCLAMAAVHPRGAGG